MAELDAGIGGVTQTARERTAIMAARRGLSLYIHGKEVRGARADGSTVLVCRVHTVHDAWHMAEVALLQVPETAPPLR